MDKSKVLKFALPVLFAMLLFGCSISDDKVEGLTEELEGLNEDGVVAEAEASEKQKALEEVKISDGLVVQWSDDLTTLTPEYLGLNKAVFDEIGFALEIKKSGVVSGGDYDKYEYVLLNVLGEMGYSKLYKVLFNSANSDAVLLTKVSASYEDTFFDSFFTKKSDLEVDGTKYKETFENSYGKFVKKEDYGVTFSIFNSSLAQTLVFEENGMKFYTSDQNGCLYMRLPDSTMIMYLPKYDFLREGENAYLNRIAFLDIDLNSGVDITENAYNYSMQGCGGFFGCLDVVNPKTFENGVDVDLKIVGKTESGGDIYGFSDLKNKYLMERIDMLTRYPVKDALPVQFSDEELANMVLFYKNAFGQYVRLTDSRLIPPAECGKPVVYLYPETTTNVSVEVFPEGGITVSDPAYNDGWVVRADPSGSIYNYLDKKIYTSLFWESESYGEFIADSGFLISDKNKAIELDNLLVRYGFNELERMEFLEYWTKKLEGSEYYFASLLPQRELDKVAPLKITPTPDNVYRLFFNFYPVAKDFKFAEPFVRPLKREGFTVVEWGGSY